MSLPTADAAPTQRDKFFALLQAAAADRQLVKLVLAKPKGADPGVERVLVRPLVLRGEDCLSFTYRHATRDVTKNLSVHDGVAQVQALLGPSFRNAHLHTRSQDAQLSIGKKGTGVLTLTKATLPADAVSVEHNREKQRWLDLDRPFLVALGVTTGQHQLVPAMSRKWKQINKFVEVFAHALAASALADTQALRVADFGSGKGYLTFAIHDWLQRTKGVQVQVTGVELRADMVRLGNEAVARLGLTGLHFDVGDVRSHEPKPMNVMIALHACDTATDHAIHLGLRAGADIIMCSPCCHKQIRPQLLSPHPLRPVLQHGVHKDQEAEMVTDSLRALLLESQGYDTQVFEFISLEHTNKNKMILGVKRRQPKPATEALAQIDEVKRFYGIREQCLETLLRADAASAT